MKKILLLAALAVGAFTAQAETIDDYINVSVNGENVTDGQTVVIPDYKYVDLDWWWSLPEEERELYILELGMKEPNDPKYASKCDISVFNKYDEPITLTYEFYRVSPSVDEVSANPAFGGYQGCVGGTCISGKDGEIGGGEKYWDLDPENSLTVDFECIDATDLAPKTVAFVYKVMEGGEAVATFTVNVDFTYEKDTTTTASVSGIGADSSEAVYYNLQGVRVANPEKGLFIKKQGSKTTKVIL